MNEKELLGNYCLVIGLEIHLHLNTVTKMFCGCSANIWELEPNTNTCPTCLGLPGALPVPNFEAVRKTQMIGLALGCDLNKNSRFDRKHYFYPDLPKGYQISQYKQPLCINGKLNLESGLVADIERVHLEEDVAKSLHEKDRTLVDFNKSGVPLVEIVSRPCFKNIEDSVDYCKQIQNIVWFLGAGEVDMEKGQMRLEANISLRTHEMESKGELMPYKVEVKNINSFKFMEKAIKAEIVRQKELLDKGETPKQENRGFNEVTGKTVPQRSKEEAKDYRYFPEPDIPPMEFSEEYINELKKSLPELPAQKIKNLVENMKISQGIAKVLVNNLGPDFVKKFDTLVAKGFNAVVVANTLVNKTGMREASMEEIEDSLTKVLPSMGDDRLEEIVVKVVSLNPKAVEDLRKGKQNSIQFLLGQVMKESKGQANPNSAKEILMEKCK